MQVKVFHDILEANARLAEMNRRLFAEKGILVANLIGSPGCGKTTLLQRTLERLQARGNLRPGVIAGDLETSRDAERIAACGAPVVQINTQGSCHLDAAMVQTVLSDLPLDDMDLMFIENVGNLVCPAGVALGETFKVALLSVTEGDEKPAKYPVIFKNAEVALITKIDLLKHTDFSVETATRDMRAINPDLAIFQLSSRTGEGMDAWVEYLEKRGAETGTLKAES